MNIFCFGISHQTADVEVRERFAIPDSALADSLTRLARIRSVDEGILLSTCNRTEFYIVSQDSLHAIANRTLETRKKEMDACNSLIEKHVSDFEFSLQQASERVISPARSSTARREDDYPWHSRQPIGMGRG
jgi:glutamyl-tRNA reductase